MYVCMKCRDKATNRDKYKVIQRNKIAQIHDNCLEPFHV